MGGAKIGTISTIALLLILVFPLSAQAGLTSTNGGIRPNPILNISINNAQRFTSDQSYYFNPAVIQGADGNVWVFYEYIYFNQHESLPVISYRTSQSPSYVYNSTNWSAQGVLSATPLSQNVSPSTSQYKNGTLYVAFASNRTGNFNIFLKKYNPGIGWSPDYQTTLNTHDQIGNSVLAANDGSLWLFYDRQVNPTTANVYYRVLQHGTIPQEYNFTNDATGIQNQQPSAYQLIDGSIVVVWTHTDASSNSNVYYRRYSGGVWGSTVSITTSNLDSHPSIMQDENTTLYVSFTHEIPQGGSNFQNAVYYMYSINNGSNWSSPTNLLNDACGTPCPASMNPAMAQLKDGRVYLFFTSNRDPQQYWNIYYATTSVAPFHHVSVTALGFGPQKIRSGWTMLVNVTVTDLGTFPESFYIFVRATNTSRVTVAAQYFSLGPGQSFSFSILWNTQGVYPAKYQISAYIPPVNGEITPLATTAYAGIAWLVPPGDVDMNGVVNILDAADVSIAWQTVPGMPLWNPMADLDGDGLVNILDASEVGIWYGVST